MYKNKCQAIAWILSFFILNNSILFAQDKMSSNNPWVTIDESEINLRENSKRQISPKKYKTFQLDWEQLQNIIREAPLRFIAATNESTKTILELPMPDGSLQKFTIKYAPVMHPNLAERYPMIRSFSGQGIDDPSAYLRFDVTPKGFHAMILSSRTSDVFIDPLVIENTKYYQSYYKEDFISTDPVVHACGLGQTDFKEESPVPTTLQSPSTLSAGDCQLRTYRLALAVTGEYTIFHGGTVEGALSAMVTSMNRVNGIYEKDAGLTMVLVENTDQLIFLDPSTDPYSNSSGDLDANQTTCDNIIGSENYDIGHLFTTGGGGVAQLRSPCTESKARGLSGQGEPVGDPFDVDYVCHEMGHQFGGNHTQNNSCNRNNSTAMEPGSASTIMGYAGICEPDVQFNSDAYFHAINIQEIAANITSGPSSSCPSLFDTGNNQPVVDAGSDYTLPISTPFALTANGTDIDEDVLTYCWEQMDNQTAPMPPISSAPRGPAFRSIIPSESPTRYFPNLFDLNNNIDPEWEELPSVSRSMNFRCTVRDNFMGAGCTDEDDMLITFVEEAGPFLVLNPNTALSWIVGSFTDVEWDVANTDEAPINCDLVHILLSTDGGSTYPITLAESIPNNGTYSIEVPDFVGTTNRVKVVCADNIFFDISDNDFTIQAPSNPDVSLHISPSTQIICPNSEVGFTVQLNGLAGFSESVDLSLEGLSEEANIIYSPSAQVTPPATVEVTITNPEIFEIGENNLILNVNGNGVSSSDNITINVLSNLPEVSSLLSPVNYSTDASTPTILEWTNADFAESYVIEIASSPDFSPANIIETATTEMNTYEMTLTNNTVYYWRVQSVNTCGTNLSTFFSFQTDNPNCNLYSSEDLPINISPDDSDTYVATIDISDDLTISDCNVILGIDHSWVGDLKASLEAPNGSIFNLFDSPGAMGTGFGCGQDNLLVTFDDDAENTADDLENTCENDDFAIQGNFQPIDPLSSLNNQSSLGPWTLLFEDIFDQDGGMLYQFDIEICILIETISELALFNEILFVENGMSETVTTTFLETNSDGNTPTEIIYTITVLPQNGNLTLNGLPLEIGSTFTQADIDNNALSYTHDASDTSEDQFIFDLQNTGGTWIPNNTFPILIYGTNIVATYSLDQTLTCINGNDAEITINALGGTPPLKYSLNGVDFQASNIFPNLEAGAYTITILDEMDQSKSLELIISAPDPVVVSSVVTDNQLNVEASGGTGILMYSIDGINYQTDPIFTDLPNGDYILYVKDANDCIDMSNFTIAFNTIAAQTVILLDVTCLGQNDGVIQVSVSGGTAPFQYSLDGMNFQDDPIFDNLAPGSYTITVMDDGGFTRETNEVNLTEPDGLDLSVLIVENDINIIGIGGAGDFTFSIDGINYQDDNSFSELASGTYAAYIKDKNGCVISEEFIILMTSTSSLERKISFELLPNPSSVFFTLRLTQNANQPTTFTISDVIGKLIYSQNLGRINANFETTIDVRHLSSGIYLAHVKSGDSLISKRLVLIK